MSLVGAGIGFLQSLTPTDIFRLFTMHPSGPGTTLGTRDPVAAKLQPIIRKMISTTGKCHDGNEAGE